jgi:hypothetical protein
VKILEQSVTNSWSSVYPLKNNNYSPKQSARTQRYENAMSILEDIANGTE